jgi:hypothetical protein
VQNLFLLLSFMTLLVSAALLIVLTRQDKISVLPLWFFGMGSIGLAISARLKWGRPHRAGAADNSLRIAREQVERPPPHDRV